MSATEITTPVEIDTKLAELYRTEQQIRQSIGSHHATLLHAAGAEFRYQGRERVTDMTVAEAREIVTERLAANDYLIGSYSADSVRETISKLDRLVLDLIENRNARIDLENLYTGWSRFFVVTSSNGHIHSSMHCSTCRPTTTYGWLPNLSGKTQTEAIQHFGPAATALCSVCFPDAPVERMDENLSTKQRDALLAGKTPEATTKKNHCSGSGKYAPAIRPRAYTEYCHCPDCGETVARTGTGKVRKHSPKEA